MYESLKKHCPHFRLFIFAFNQMALEVLQKLALPNVTVISLQDFEDDALLKVKPTRSRAEYSWTCTSSTIHYVLNTFQVPHCTYLDADLYFYQNPALLIQELQQAGKEVLITPHRYTRRYDQSKDRGRYCVQFMYFHNSDAAKMVLQHWRQQCLDWCYAHVEPGKFGDQKYLDQWLQQYPQVHELVQEGTLGPWNCQQYSVQESENQPLVIRKDNKKSFPLILFHFHGTKLYPQNKAVFAPRSYSLSQSIKQYFFQPYVTKLWQKEQEIWQQLPEYKGLDFNGKGTIQAYRQRIWFEGRVAWFKRNILGRIFPPSLF